MIKLVSRRSRPNALHARLCLERGRATPGYARATFSKRSIYSAQRRHHDVNLVPQVPQNFAPSRGAPHSVQKLFDAAAATGAGDGARAPVGA